MMMDSFLTLLAVAAAATGFTLGLLWIVRRFFGVLPDTFNSATTNARLSWFLLAIGILAFWLISLDEMLAAEKWSLPFCKNLAWVVVLPAFFLGAVKRVISGETINLNTPSSLPVEPRELDSETETAIADALRRGKKLEAIRLYRERTGVGLKEAKKHVEALEVSAS
jgi:hypothetical protein